MKKSEFSIGTRSTGTARGRAFPGALTAGLLAMVALTSGCVRHDAEFSHREEYNELIPEGQEYVHKVLGTYFGKPTRIVAWEKLPLKLHAAVGTVGEGATSLSVPVNFTQENLPLRPELEAAWLSGNLFQKNDTPALIEAIGENGSVMFPDPGLAQLPAAGDRVAIGPGEVLKFGRVLYAEHCLHCHGVSGDSHGPTAPYLNPKPRDFRRGIFKFTTTVAASRASRTDLSRTIDEGIPGTYMPSFKLLTPDENMALVEYVLWLAMRGEVEYQLTGQLKNDYSNEAFADRVKGGESAAEIRKELTDAVNGGEMADTFNGIVDTAVERWVAAQEEASLVTPTVKHLEATAESIARGRALYLSKDLNCVACHGEAGLGDGPQTYSITKNSAGADNPTPGLYDDWGNLVVPRNLTTGIYRGGRRPIDLFSRLHGGIKGTPMPAFGGKKSDEELWDLVNYIMSVPYEKRTPGDGSKEAKPAEAPPQVAAGG
ncbi:Cytochrome c [Caulifigura coniformis]|uniref:Cytochrome c n=1 Tax=Caulifigura coniformis TaxID=2527983 RepID=A0A517SKT6_9PLAN|nr:cytochrome c [Caulifigura coniformis]QDT56730.1 Cytochrome c [Caulifigura coniformis]